MKILILAALAVAGTAVAGVVAHASPSKATIRVTEREFRIGLSSTRAPAGRVRLEIRNTGRLAHALAISGAGVRAKTKVIRPGTTAVLLVDLRSGPYAIWCPIPGHAAQGMKATLRAPAAAAGAGSATTTSGGVPGTTTVDPGVPWG